jgi:radical SAM superfamily enzyme YgiQ (UPF0313 family)
MSRSLRYEIGPIRPPSEAYSLLVRFTRNCPWNKCEFCHIYKGRKFEKRPLADIERDIDTVKTISDEIAALSWKEGYGGKIAEGLVERIFSSEPHNECFRSVAVWMYFGANNVFIQDANSLAMKAQDLVDVLRYLKKTFPAIDRITSYARSQTLAQLWSVESLHQLREAGLTRLHLGMESGSDFLLKYMRKGVTKEQHVYAGRMVRESGIELSEYVVPGLGGRKWWRQHALETADALNKINPDFIRFRTLKVLKDMPLYKKTESGDFLIAHEEEILKELRLLIQHLDGITSHVQSDHALNLLEEVDGKLPEDKQKILDVIERYFALSTEQRLVYRMGRRAGIYRRLDDLNDEVTFARLRKAIREIEEKEPGSIEKQLSLLLENYI